MGRVQRQHLTVAQDQQQRIIFFLLPTALDRILPIKVKKVPGCNIHFVADFESPGESERQQRDCSRHPAGRGAALTPPAASVHVRLHPSALHPRGCRLD